MTATRCEVHDCTREATHYVNVDAYVNTHSRPITMLLQMPICSACAIWFPSARIVTPRMWDILDTWAIQGKPCGLVDRELVDVYAVRITNPEADIKAHQAERHRG